MSFLRLGALWALPLVLLPVVIHLIHRRRHPAVSWAAMMFLHRAAQSRRGPAKIRRWLILAIRMFVVAALVFALARPLSSGVFGVAASRVVSGATTMVLVDRSPSMQRRMPDGETRQVAAVRRVAGTMKTLGADQFVLIDSVANAPREFSGADKLLKSAVTSAADSVADMPGMLRDAATYLRENDRRVADIWICSDRQECDWRPESPQWQQVAEEIDRLGDGVRLHLVKFPPDPRVNSSVALTRKRWIETGQGRALAISIVVLRDDPAAAIVPVRITVDGVTSTVDVEVVDGRGELLDIRVDTAEDSVDVFGQVSIPADVNAADDQWFFAASSDQNRPIGLVTEESCDALEVASEVLGNVAEALGGAETGPFEQGKRLEGGRQLPDGVACLLWQGRLPEGDDAAAVTRFLDVGGSAVFFPPPDVSGVVEETPEFLGIRWGRWQRDEVAQAVFDQWEFAVGARCSIEGDLVRLSSVGTNGLLIGKIRVGKGTAWFCGADVIDPDSRFVKDGVVLYGLLSEALDASPRFAAGDDGWVAGQFDQQQMPDDQAMASLSQALVTDERQSGPIEFGHHAGVFLLEGPEVLEGAEESPSRMLAINRPLEESQAEPIDEAQLKRLIPGFDWNQVSMEASGAEADRGFVREVWGAIWTMLIAGMLLEAWLSLPLRSRGAA